MFRYLFWPILLVLIATQPLPLLAQSLAEVEGLAKDFYLRGEYYRSVTEYQRLAFYYPQKAAQAQLMVARALMAGGRQAEAIALLEKRVQLNPSDWEALMLLGLAQLDQDQAAPFGLRQTQVEAAMAHFSRLPSGEPMRERLFDLSQDWRERAPVARPNPALAGGLSAVIPGAGSAYLGRWREGSYAFLITGLFALGSREAYQSGQPALGAVLGGFGLVFYGGNIYLAVNSAHKLGDQNEAQQLEQYRRKQGAFFIPEQPQKPGRY